MVDVEVLVDVDDLVNMVAQGQNMLRQEENGCSLELVGVLELAFFVGSSGACAGAVGWRF